MRSFKALALILLATLVVCSTAATGAAADEITAESYPALLSGKDDGTAFSLKLKVGTIACKEARYAGTVSAATTSLAVTPTIPEKTALGAHNCSLDGFFASTIHTNGCNYLLSVNGSGVTTGAASIECPAGKEITVTALVNCTIHIRAQAIVGNATYVNIGSGSTREITASIKTPGAGGGLEYIQTGTGGGTPCETGLFYAGGWTVNLTLTAAKESDGTHVGLFLS
ncbi:MAG TPA: hypothetical protein VFX85_12680 [Solirubrobacterales bacterium]|nr:hypothetical protein [Solirubrobacterales bacterium]